MYKKIKAILAEHTNDNHTPIFFKTGRGEYAAHDYFLGIKVPILRKIAADFKGLEIKYIKQLLTSKFNDERLLALFILTHQYKNGDLINKQAIFDFYLKNLAHINNWNLVDSSAHLIIGEHLLTRNKTLLKTLALSSNLWERRIAIVATNQFIRNNNFKPTLQIAQLLLNDQHDLIHKAAGWMLREVGKKQQDDLIMFLDKFHHKMPRTMLRYAIERLPLKLKKQYLARI